MDESDPVADLISLLATPVAGAVRSVDQFRKGVDEFLRGIDNFNRTMENLNESAERINRLLGEVEEPIRLAVPQVTRAVRNADEMMQAVSGPAMAVAPGLNRLADTLSNPSFQQLPDQLGQFTELLSDMSARMAPLTQFAETAGGLFGMRIPGTGRPARSAASPSAPESAAAEGVAASERATAATGSSSKKASTSKKTAGSKGSSTSKKTAGSKRASTAKKAARTSKSGSAAGTKPDSDD